MKYPFHQSNASHFGKMTHLSTRAAPYLDGIWSINKARLCLSNYPSADTCPWAMKDAIQPASRSAGAGRIRPQVQKPLSLQCARETENWFIRTSLCSLDPDFRTLSWFPSPFQNKEIYNQHNRYNHSNYKIYNCNIRFKYKKK